MGCHRLAQGLRSIKSPCAFGTPNGAFQKGNRPKPELNAMDFSQGRDRDLTSPTQAAKQSTLGEDTLKRRQMVKPLGERSNRLIV